MKARLILIFIITKKIKKINVVCFFPFGPI